MTAAGPRYTNPTHARRPCEQCQAEYTVDTKLLAYPRFRVCSAACFVYWLATRT